MKRSLFVSAVAALLLSSCSHTAPGPQNAVENPSAGPSATLQNPISFPLPDGSTVLATKKFSQTVSPGERASALLAAGAGTYAGNEVIAGTQASFSELEAWLHSLESKAPAGYRPQTQSSGVGSARQMANKHGIDFAVFRDSAKPKRAVLVIAIDPAVANRDLGPALQAVKRYQILPAALRGNIDATVKRHFGISIEQMTQAGSPLGVAMNAMSSFSDKNERAVVLVDAAKE